MSTTSVDRRQIVSNLRDKAEREAVAQAYVEEGIAFQIRETRRARKWTQEDLADRAGTNQETISRLEASKNGSTRVDTLLRLAAAFDVALLVRFVPFGQLVDWIQDVSIESLRVPDFEHDPHIHERQQDLPRHVDLNMTLMHAKPVSGAPPEPGQVATGLSHFTWSRPNAEGETAWATEAHRP